MLDRRIFRTIASAALALAFAASSMRGEELSPSLREMLVRHRCDVAGRLKAVYESNESKSEHDRYVTVVRRGHPQSFVQCIFYDKRTRVLCEASSGFFRPKGMESFHLSVSAIAQLAGLGFSTDASKGNYLLEADATHPDFNALADLLLKALHNAYDARAADGLEFAAPLAPTPRAAKNCIPLS